AISFCTRRLSTSLSPSFYRRRFGSRLFGLLHWPGARDEDVDQPPGAFLPVGAGGYISDADQSVKQIAGIEVFAYFAALDAAFDQIAKCLLHQSVGIFKHFLVISEQRVQRRCDDLFCSDSVNEQQQPRPQRFDRRESGGEFLRGGGEL